MIAETVLNIVPRNVGLIASMRPRSHDRGNCYPSILFIFQRSTPPFASGSRIQLHLALTIYTFELPNHAFRTT